MTLRPLIFVSHSVAFAAPGQEKSPDEEILDAVIAALEAAELQPYYDRRDLEPGDPWRAELHQALERCQGAVVLITKRALNVQQYPWLFAESSILFHRQRQARQTFKVVPVLMPEVTPEDLKARPFDAVQAGEYQVASGDPAKLTAQIVKAFEALKDENALKTMQDPLSRLSIQLAKVQPPEVLVQAALIGDFGTDGWRDPPGLLEALILARALVEFGMPHDPLAEEKLAGVLEAISGGYGDEQQFYDFLALLVPFWLGQIDSRLPEIVSRQPSEPRCALRVGVRQSQTGRWFLSRATMAREPYVCEPPLDTCGKDEARLARHIQETFAGWFNLNAPDAVKFRKTAQRAAAREPVYVVLSREAGDEVIKALRLNFPWFYFVVLTGDESLDTTTYRPVELLNPVLPPEREDDIEFNYGYAYSIRSRTQNPPNTQNP